MGKENLSFTITGANGNIGFQMKVWGVKLVSRAKGKGTNANMTSKHGTVLIGKVLAGTVKAGDEIKLKFPRGNQNDTVVSVEIQKKAITEGKEGDEIGIALQSSTKSNITDFFF